MSENEIVPGHDTLGELLESVTRSHDALLELDKRRAQEMLVLGRQYDMILKVLSAGQGKGSRFSPLRGQRKDPQNLDHLLKHMDRGVYQRLLVEPKIMTRLDFERSPGCWIWTGQMVSGHPVGIIQSELGKRRILRRWFFDRVFGEKMLEGQNLDGVPECNETQCVNPFHSMKPARFRRIAESKDLYGELDFHIDHFTAFKAEGEEEVHLLNSSTKTTVIERMPEVTTPRRTLADIIGDMEEIPVLPDRE
jgi:hypothetical protein